MSDDRDRSVVLFFQEGPAARRRRAAAAPSLFDPPQLGIQHEDIGLDTKENAGGVTGALQRVYRDHWMWDCGIALKDWRYAVRICNIDISDLAGGTPADLIDFMEQAEETIPDNLGRRAFYMNRRVRRFLRKQYRTDVTSGGGLTYENVGGKRVTMFGETSVRITDALTMTEATVS